MSSDRHSIRMKCAHCGTAQRFVADYLPDGASLSCSNCHALLGHWGELMAASNKIRRIAGV